MTLRDFNSKYKYKPDINYDDWSKCKEIDCGYRGDCESYCISLKEDVEGFDDLEYYFCYLNGIGHCIGRLDNKWIDCNTKELRGWDDMSDIYTDVRKVWYPEYLIRKLKAFLLSLFYKDKNE